MLNRRQIAGSRALVSGASSGIGRAIALELGRHGADVVVMARREERLRQVAADIEAGGGRAEIVAGDVTDESVRDFALQRSRERFGGLDTLVNNAGIAATGRFEDASPDRLRRIFEVNFFAFVELTRAALPLLKEGRAPIVVNVGSILGHVAIPSLSEYCAAKFAVRGFTESLRAELAPRGIDVLLVSPATVETEIWDRMIEETGKTSWRAKRGATPEFIARRTVQAMRRGRREILPGIPPKLVNLANRLCPSIVARVLERRQ
jgi:short-subunit dehydrogenase